MDSNRRRTGNTQKVYGVDKCMYLTSQLFYAITVSVSELGCDYGRHQFRMASSVGVCCQYMDIRDICGVKGNMAFDKGQA